MPIKLRYQNMFIRIYPNEAATERPHVHVTLGKGAGRARMKVWLDTLVMNKASGDWPRKKIEMALKNIELNQEYLLEEWAQMFGGTKPIR